MGVNCNFSKLSLYNLLIFKFFFSRNDVEAVIGKARCLEKNGSFLKSIEILNQMYAVNPKFLITLFEKMRLQLAIKDWNQVDECANLALTIDRYCIQPQLYLIVKALVWETNHQPLDTKLSELIQSLELREPQNSKLYYHCAQLLSHLVRYYIFKIKNNLIYLYFYFLYSSQSKVERK